MIAGGPTRAPQAILFACEMNAVRSPMALALFRHYFGRTLYGESAGVRKGDADPFAIAVIEEMGLDIGKHRPHTFEELEDAEGLNFDLIVTLSPPAHHKALEMTRTLAADVEYWPVPDVSHTTGSREQILDAYRSVRDILAKRIRDRFGAAARGNE